MLCLMNIITLCGSWWFVMIIHENFMMPHIEILYFGPRFRHMFGSMLEPFRSLYKIHAAMTAYEIYKETVQLLPLGRASVDCLRNLAAQATWL